MQPTVRKRTGESNSFAPLSRAWHTAQRRAVCSRRTAHELRTHGLRGERGAVLSATHTVLGTQSLWLAFAREPPVLRTAQRCARTSLATLRLAGPRAARTPVAAPSQDQRWTVDQNSHKATELKNPWSGFSPALAFPIVALVLASQGYYVAQSSNSFRYVPP